jgi:hypothetical protein
MEKISIELPVQAWNVVMQALAQRPYAEVFELIAELKRQGDAASASTYPAAATDEDAQQGSA